MNINIDTSNIDLVHNPDILALVLKSLPKKRLMPCTKKRIQTLTFIVISTF